MLWSDEFVKLLSMYVRAPLSQPQCGFASTEEGNKLTEEEEWNKLRLIKEISEEVWGQTVFS